MSQTINTPPVPDDDAPNPPPPRPGRLHRTVDAVDERLGIRAVQYPVPAHANTLAYSLGGLTAVAFRPRPCTGVISDRGEYPG